MDIEATDVVRLIAQFLKEHRLQASLAVLQRETGVSLCTVDNMDSFKADIVGGRWDAVLASVEQAQVPHDKRVALYEQIVVELAEQRDFGPARALLRQTEPMELLRTIQPDRYLALERLLSRTSFDPQHAYGGSREARRRAIAEELAREVRSAPPSRLLTLLGQAVAWQQQQGLVPEGAPLDLLFGRAQAAAPGEDKAPCRQLATIKFAKKQHPNCVAFSPCGAYLATGSTDGFVEMWSTVSWKVAAELEYQAKSALLMMEDAVACLAFSPSGDLVCAGSQGGRVSVWRVATGACVKRFTVASSHAVSCAAFSKDGSQVLVGFGSALRIYGLHSGSMLKEFQGHTAPVTGAVFSESMGCVLSVSEDGSVRVWDAATAGCVHAVVPGAGQGLLAPAAHGIVALPGAPSDFVVFTKSASVYIVTTGGAVRRTFTATGACKELLAGAVTPNGRYIMAVSSSSTVHYFDADTGAEQTVEAKVPGAEILGMAVHPKLNIAAFFSRDRHIPIWTA
ncbi:Serine/threonine-protein kinase smu1 [Coemansia helicoidea]|uniref:Serine/threonine-protein kinase smu1 n=2 Tax=Coemansia TaxID=4863 RepID=A0ACC1LGW2_9FUNG|nr:Serine/threonine-protein kinase smu1 [Coemansia helicoidea]